MKLHGNRESNKQQKDRATLLLLDSMQIVTQVMVSQMHWKFIAQKLIFINVKRVVSFDFMYYELSRGISIVVAAFKLHIVLVLVLLLTTMMMICISVNARETMRKAFSFHWVGEFTFFFGQWKFKRCCMFIWTEFGVAVNYAITSIFVEWSTWGGKSLRPFY